MKRRGVINQPLSEALAGIGHGNTFMICDAGFPIPKNVKRIDLALCFGIPNMKQTIKAVLEEIVIESLTIAEEMKGKNKTGYEFLQSTFKNQEISEIPQENLVEVAKTVDFIVRTGELGCYSNILFVGASGVEEYMREFVIDL